MSHSKRKLEADLENVSKASKSQRTHPQNPLPADSNAPEHIEHVEHDPSSSPSLPDTTAAAPAESDQQQTEHSDPSQEPLHDFKAPKHYRGRRLSQSIDDRFSAIYFATTATRIESQPAQSQREDADNSDSSNIPGSISQLSPADTQALDCANEGTAAVNSVRRLLGKDISRIFSLLRSWSVSDMAMAGKQLSHDSDANTQNAKQVLKKLEKGTIWHAVSYADTLEGQQSFVAANAKSNQLWQVGEERGVMGETPLHLAVLYCSSEAHKKMIFDLWDTYPALRCAIYEGQLYHGENVLHIAIVKRLGIQVIQKFLSPKEGKILLEQRATGRFFSDPRESDGCCNFGEYPLAFAACSNQKDTFDYLVQCGAKLDIFTGNHRNLLHLLVLHSVHRPQQDVDSDIFEATALESHYDDPCEWCRDMFDHIQKLMMEKGIYEEMWDAQDVEGYTPLTLCAARGSRKMFDHLFQKLMKKEWQYGPVTCSRLYLHGVDIPIDTREQMSKSVIEVVVESERLDIISEGPLDKILDTKWEKYAKRIFSQRFVRALVVASVLTVIIAVDSEHPLGALLLLLAEIVWPCLHLEPFLRELRRMSATGLSTSAWSNLGSMKSLGPLLDFPLAFLLLYLRVVVPSLTLRASSRGEDMEVPPLPSNAVVLEVSRREKLGVSQVEKQILILQTIFAFQNIFTTLMGFPEFGHFVLMLLKMLREDFRKFFGIYIVVLFGFAQLFYVSSNLQNTGWGSFVDALMVGFNATLKEINDNLSEEGNSDWMTKNCVNIVVLGNFFFVSIVLINLLIAMMSSTYERIDQRAQKQWKLERARIVIDIDKDMKECERMREENVYWKVEMTKIGGKVVSERFVMFTTSEDRADYLLDRRREQEEGGRIGEKKGRKKR